MGGAEKGDSHQPYYFHSQARGFIFFIFLYNYRNEAGTKIF
jgi:hypothetical protein